MVNPSENQKIDAFFKKYSEDEHRQFQKILKASESGNKGVERNLFNKLKNDEKPRYQEYKEGWKEVKRIEASLKAEKKEINSQISQIDNKQEELKNEKKEIIHYYAENFSKKVVGNQTPESTPPPSSSRKNHPK